MPGPGGRLAFDHDAVWRAIDTLAAERGLTASGLAREAGLDTTAFNPSKRRTGGNGPMRWPTLATLARVLGAADIGLEEFARLVAGARTLGLAAPPFRAATQASIDPTRVAGGGRPGHGRVPMLPLDRLGGMDLFDSGGHPQGLGWQDIDLPGPFAAGGYVVRLEVELPPVYRRAALLVIDPEAVLSAGDRALHYDTEGVWPVEVLDPYAPRLRRLGTDQTQNHPAGTDGVVSLRLHRIMWASQ